MTGTDCTEMPDITSGLYGMQVTTGVGLYEDLPFPMDYTTIGVPGNPGPPGPEGARGPIGTRANLGTYAYNDNQRRASFLGGALGQGIGQSLFETGKSGKEMKQNKIMANNTLRIVRVVIADPDANLPLENRVIYDSKEFTTDLDDKELFFEINIKEKLDAHNAVRIKTIDKEASKDKSKDAYLEPLRIRDLKMMVVTVASF